MNNKSLKAFVEELKVLLREGGGVSPDFDVPLQGLDAVLTGVIHNQKENSLLLQVESDSLISAALINSAADELKTLLSVRSVVIYPKYKPELYNREYIYDIIKLMRNKAGVINGFLDDIEIFDDDENVEIELKHGGLEFLKQEKIERELEKLIKGFFEREIKVTFSGKTELDTTEYLDRQEREAEDIPKIVFEKQQLAPKTTGGRGLKKPRAFEPKEVTLKFAPPNGSFTENAKLIFGDEITQPPVNMSEVEGSAHGGSQCIVWGEVFDVVKKTVRQGKNVVLNISFTDYTSSHTVKIFTTPDRGDGFSVIKTGGAILVKGVAAHDDFEKTTLIEPSSIMLVEPIRRVDNAPQKRVELHLHTNMSDMDALTPVNKLLKRAFDWGHRAIAITDHGNAQSFPDAMNTYEKLMKEKPDADFKVIYGIESYFVRDGQPLVQGCNNYNLDDGLVVFDVETTGLSSADDRIIELGAVKIKGLEIIDEFQSFVEPECEIPQTSTAINGITNEMVKDAPCEKTVYEQFIKFAGDCPLIAHNAEFDTNFLRAGFSRTGLEYAYSAIDTVKLCRAAVPNKKHSLDAMAKHFKIGDFNHHRAIDDAKALALIFRNLVQDLRKGRLLKFVGDINTALGNTDPKKERYFHQIILVKNKIGLKNLYKLISYSNINCYYKKPRIPLSELKTHREGLLIGSACEQGELYQAVLKGASESELLKIIEFYDFLEIQPISNNEFLVRKGMVDSNFKLQVFNKKIVELGKKAGKPVVATCDVHFLEPRDYIYREILQSGQGYSDAADGAPLFLRTTDEMLSEFEYLDEKTAFEVVVENPNKIADMIEVVRPIPTGTYNPKIDGADDDLKTLTWGKARELYGETLKESVSARIQKELDAIIKYGFAALYMIARKLVKKSEECGYLVGSRGSVGSSVVATLLGISEVNPLPPHYRCPTCRYNEFLEGGEVQSGYDLPPKNCPKCNTAMARDGHDIPFETFLGFKGDKAPYIDLNFSGEYQARSHKYTEELFGKDHVFKAGTISAVQDKTAFGFVKKYLDERGVSANKAEINRLVKGCTGVKRTTSQHPGGMVVVPREFEVYDFTPIQHPGGDSSKDEEIITTHFDFHALHDTILKLDELGHDVPTLYKYLEDMTGVKIADVPTTDDKVMSLFTDTKALELSSEDKEFVSLGTYGLPEFGTNFVIQMLKEAKPQKFSDLLQISGLSHGTDVWIGNARNLIADGTCTISQVIGTRDNIMVHLMHKGMEPDLAFKITEITRKGLAAKLFDETILAAFEKCGVEPWYVESCKKIKYMFPKAHAAAYVTGAVKLGWFKVNYPSQFYAAVLTKHTENIEVDCVLGGKETVRARLKAIADNPDSTAKEKNTYEALLLVYEMLLRGIKFLPTSYKRSHATRYIIEGKDLLLPFMAVSGCGESAAKKLTEVIAAGDYICIDDIQRGSGINNTVFEKLKEMKVFEDLPQSAQISLFDL